MAFKPIDRFAERLRGAGILTDPIANAPWIDDFEARLGLHLPKSFRYLFTHYTFPPFEWGPILFFGSSEADDPLCLHIAASQDRAILHASRQGGLVQFGRPGDGGYDPVCLGPCKPNREPPVIQLDHEAILTKGRVKVLKEIGPSFVALAERLMTDGSEPVAVD